MKRTQSLKIRLTKTELEYIKDLQNRSGLNLSQLCRSILLKAKIKTPITRELIMELNRMGNNLNQLTKHLNTTKTPLNSVGLSLLNDIYLEMRGLREEVMQCF